MAAKNKNESSAKDSKKRITNTERIPKDLFKFYERNPYFKIMIAEGLLWVNLQNKKLNLKN